MDVAVLFPGQGTQAPGLGRVWVGHPAWSLVDEAEAVLDRALTPLLLDDDPAVVARTEDAQLAVFLASSMAWDAARPALASPTVFAGHSLGQLTALVAAGVVTFSDGVRLVAARAEACQRATERSPGAMAALLGVSVADAELAAAAEPRCCWVANDNAPGQVVIAGTPDGVAAAAERARAAGARRVMPVAVAGAFHTPLMQAAADEFATPLAETTFAPAAVPVVSNEDAIAYNDGDGWRGRLVRHLVVPVRWRATMATIAERGVGQLVEVGPGATLTGLARRTVPGLATANVSSPDDVAAVVAPA